jgi:FAD dependent oxidoreductase
MNYFITDVLVVGGGTGGTAAAIQAARCGVSTILVSEFAWLGGMLTAAGVSAPDGNELKAWQTGLWGQFLRELSKKQTGGLDNSWVSMFAYDPSVGAEIFARWAQQLPNLKWISGQTPLEVFKVGDRVTKVRFENYAIEAKIVIDGTELGDLLALAAVSHRWGWELQAEFNELSAPEAENDLTKTYPVQAPTWVFLMKDYGDSKDAPEISPYPLRPLSSSPSQPYKGAWDNYGAEKFLNYGRLPGGLFMINWPIAGNDYGEKLGRLIESETAKEEFLEEAFWHSYDFARFIQIELGDRYGLAENIFPNPKIASLNSSFAFHPYYRESRRLQGLVTITERDILPKSQASVAPLPVTSAGKVSSIAIGNYANDHHYPGIDFPLHPKSIRWGGRWTGTPFTIPYGALVPAAVDGLLVCEKNISVSHIANGSTRLQPVVTNIGQAAGMAAALCVKLNCQPRDLAIDILQEALLCDRDAPAAIIPLFNLSPEHRDWLKWQRYYLENPEDYPIDGNCLCREDISNRIDASNSFSGIFEQHGQDYSISLMESGETWQLVTLDPTVDRQLQNLKSGQSISGVGRFNASGNWIVVERL